MPEPEAPAKRLPLPFLGELGDLAVNPNFLGSQNLAGCLPISRVGWRVAKTLAFFEISR